MSIWVRTTTLWPILLFAMVFVVRKTKGSFMYVKLTSGKMVQVIGPFDGIDDFLVWAKEENWQGKYEVIERKEESLEFVIRCLQTS